MAVPVRDAGQRAVVAPPELSEFGSLSFPGSAMKVLFALDDASYVLDAIELPAGSKIEVSGKTLTVSGNEQGRVFLSVPMDLAQVASQPVAVIENGAKWGPEGPVTITIPGREVVSLAAPRLDLSTWFSVLFMVDESKGIRFGSSDTAPHPPGRRTVVHPDGTTKYFGPGKQLRDVDWVVVKDTLAEPEESVLCTYAGVNGARFNVLLEREVRALSIFDRRTGKKVAARRFVSSADCEGTASGKKHGSGYVEAASSSSQHTSVDDAAVAAWIEAQRRK